MSLIHVEFVFSSSCMHEFTCSYTTIFPKIFWPDLHWAALHSLNPHWPRTITQNYAKLRLPSRQSTLPNSRINLAECHIEQCRTFPRRHPSLRFPQTYPSSLLLVNQIIWLEQWRRAALISKPLQYLYSLTSFLKKLYRHEGQAPTAYHYTVPRNCAILLGSPPCCPTFHSSWKLHNFN